MSEYRTKRFRVTELEMWGRLIKSWATRLDYIDQDLHNQPPRKEWANKWPDTTGTPSAVTVPDTDPKGTPRKWCLPAPVAVDVPRPDGSKVVLPMAVAMTVDEFKERVGAAAVVISEMPAQYTHVIIVQGGEKTMVMRLPPKDTLQGSEDDLIQGEPYEFADFYYYYFGNQAGKPPAKGDRRAIMRLHANRIGEYTLNNCI